MQPHGCRILSHFSDNGSVYRSATWRNRLFGVGNSRRPGGRDRANLGQIRRNRPTLSPVNRPWGPPRVRFVARSASQGSVLPTLAKVWHGHCSALLQTGAATPGAGRATVRAHRGGYVSGSEWMVRGPQIRWQPLPPIPFAPPLPHRCFHIVRRNGCSRVAPGKKRIRLNDWTYQRISMPCQLPL